jgi:hypothetical protein
MVLPILPLVPGVLRPHYGYVFDQSWIDPYESVLGILWKYAKMNSIAAPQLIQQICFDDSPIDPYLSTGLGDDEFDWIGFAQAVGLPKKTVHAGIAKSKFGRTKSLMLRWCTKCMRRGYHSVLHQYEEVQWCPIHGVQMLSICSACGQASAYRLSAMVLNSAFKCSNCGRPFAEGSTSFLKRPSLDQAARTALTRCAIGLPWYPRKFKPAR